MAKTQQRALLFSEKGGQYHITTREIPRPGPGFVLVKIESCALNPVDEFSRLTGTFVDKYPYIAGNDGSGVVEEVVRVCRRILQSPFRDDRGTFQEYALVDVPLIAKIPDHLTFDQASTIPLGLTTAAVGLYEKRKERGGVGLVAPWVDGGRGRYAGQPIYIPGGSSSVGQYALQLAKLSGFNPIITTASAHNEGYCRAAGATHVIDYSTTPYASIPAVVKEIANGPIEIIYDAISTPESQRANWEILRPNGSLVLVHPPANDIQIEPKDSQWVVFVFGSVRGPGKEEFGRELYAVLPGLLADGSIKPNKVESIAEGLQGVPAALARVFGGKASGVKLVAHPGETPVV
ncbi:GroES-like protein [Russula brevipes]|nr:GroES-like protein [Russula brevipes]